MVRKLLTTGGGLFKTGACIAEQLAAKAIDLWGYHLRAHPVVAKDNSSKAAERSEKTLDQER
jgi:hypothetical protein